MRVCIGIPVFNDHENILRCIDSVLAQSYTDIEVIVSDNASTDETLEKIKSRAKDPRLIILTESINQGVNYNYLKVLSHAKSPRFMFLGSDDYLSYNSIENLVNCIKLKDKYTIGITNFHMYSVENPKKVINKINFGMEKNGKIDNIVKRVFSDEKINYTFLGFYDTDVLKKLLIKLPIIKSADRWMNLGGFILGTKYYFVKEAIYFRGIKKDPFIVKNKKDLLSLSIISNTMAIDLRNISLIDSYLNNLSSKSYRKKIQIITIIIRYVIYCLKKHFKISLRPVLMKLPLFLRSIVLRNPVK